MSGRFLLTLAAVIAAYTSRVSAKGSSRAHRERHRLLAKFVSARGAIVIDEAIPDDLEGWIESNAKWKSDWTILRVSNTIKRPFNWARRKGLIARNPFESVAYSPGPRGKPMDWAHFKLLLRATDAVFRRALLFMSITGCRPSELSALEWTFIDCKHGTAVLHIHKTCRSRKDREPRVIYLSALAVRLLVWIRRQDWHDPKYVFQNGRAGPWTTHSLDMRIWRLREEVGIPRAVKLYGVRHSWATGLAINGTALEILAALLGHTTIDMARHYIHIAGNAGFLRESLEKGLRGNTIWNGTTRPDVK